MARGERIYTHTHTHAQTHTCWTICWHSGVERGWKCLTSAANLFADARAAVNGDVLELLEAAVGGKAQPKDVAGSLKAALEKAPALDLVNRLPDLLWLVGEECVEAGPDASERKAAFKSLIQQLVVCASLVSPNTSFVCDLFCIIGCVDFE